MATLPFRTPLFKLTSGVFTLSICIDLLLLAGVSASTTQPAFVTSLLTAAGGGFVGVFGIVYYLIRGMLSRSSPKSLVTLFTETITFDEYLDESKAVADRPAENAHPLQPLYRFVMAAISHNEFTTAQTALTQYQAYTASMLEQCHHCTSLHFS